jgi:hypothetical protein
MWRRCPSIPHRDDNNFGHGLVDIPNLHLVKEARIKLLMVALIAQTAEPSCTPNTVISA